MSEVKRYYADGDWLATRKPSGPSISASYEVVMAKDYDALLSSNERTEQRCKELEERNAHLEALVLSVRDEYLRAVQRSAMSHAADGITSIALSTLLEQLDSMPLPDARAEKIRAVVEAAIRLDECWSDPEQSPAAQSWFRQHVREYKAAK